MKSFILAGLVAWSLNAKAFEFIFGEGVGYSPEAAYSMAGRNCYEAVSTYFNDCKNKGKYPRKMHTSCIHSDKYYDGSKWVAYSDNYVECLTLN